MRFVALVLCLVTAAPATAQLKEKLTEAQARKRIAALRTDFAKQEADYLALVTKARADLERAAARYAADKDAAAYQDAIHNYHWAITGNSALGEIGKTIASLRELHKILDDPEMTKRGYGELATREALKNYQWVERNVWARMIDPVVPAAAVDRSYLSKKPIKLLMAGDSITDYMDPGVTMPDYLDSRFQILGQGLAGHSVHSWFTSGSTPAVLAWQPDIVIIMLGTNGTTAAMADSESKPGSREKVLAKYRDDLLSLRKLESKPQVVLVTVPAQGPGLWHQGVPAMWELQSHIARENRFPLIDMSKALAGTLSEIPNGHAFCANRKTVGKWSHSFDDAHCSNGPAMAKYYGLVARQVLEPEKWYNLNLSTSATASPDWKEAWLLAQCMRDPVLSPDRALGMQKSKVDDGYKIVPHEGKIKRGKANGEVSFLRPKTGGDFYIMPSRTHSLTFGRPYQVHSNTPPRDVSFPARYDVTGTLTRGDGRPASGISIALGKQSTTTNAAGRFTFAGVQGNIIEHEMTIEPVR